MPLGRLQPSGFRTHHRDTLLLTRLLIRSFRLTGKFDAESVHVHLFSVLLGRYTRNVILHSLLRKRITVGSLLYGPKAGRLLVGLGRDSSRQLTVASRRAVQRSQTDISSVFREYQASILATNHGSSVLLTAHGMRRSIIISNSRVTNLRPTVDRLSVNYRLQLLMMTGRRIKTRRLRFTITVNTRTRTQPKLTCKASTINILPISGRKDNNFHRTVTLGRNGTVRAIRRVNRVSIREDTTADRVSRIQARDEAGKFTCSERGRQVFNADRGKVTSNFLLILQPLRGVVRDLNRRSSAGAHSNLLQDHIVRFLRRAKGSRRVNQLGTARVNGRVLNSKRVTSRPLPTGHGVLGVTDRTIHRQRRRRRAVQLV